MMKKMGVKSKASDYFADWRPMDFDSPFDYRPQAVARPLRRTIQENIEDSIADFYIEHPEYKELVADLIDDKIVISNQAQEAAETTDEEVPAE